MNHIRISIVMAFLMLAGTPPLLADSSGNAGENVRWTLNDFGTLTFSGSGTMKDFGRNQPYNPAFVKNAVINEGITSIGKNTFKGCKKLENASLPSTLRHIGDRAFAGCRKLAVLTIPYGVESIGTEAFKACEHLTELDVPASVHRIDARAFAECKSLVITRLPSTLKSLGADAYDGCRLLEVINELPDFITTNTAAYYKLSRTAVGKYRNKNGLADADIRQKNDDVRPAATAKHQHTKMNDDTRLAVPENVAPADVDLQVPVTERNNDKTFAVIISNENYRRMEKVPYALNDGEIFALYCLRTLGIPAANIIHISDATSGMMREALDDLSMARRITGDEMKVIFYYSGHGAPDEQTREGYLVPVDASRINENVCLPMSELYGLLAGLDASSVTVFLDACFSGGERSGGTLMAANGERAVLVKPKLSQLTGKVVVFSATDADQTALPYADKGHGMFTYYLLRKLRDTKGNASLAELEAYLRDKVKKSAFSINRREQTPTLSVSPGAGTEWKNWRLNQ